MKLLHLGPMQLGPEMVLGVVTVVKPKLVVPFVIRTDAPGDRFVRISTIVQEITIQISAAMSQIIKGKEVQPKLPVYQKANGYVAPSTTISIIPQRASTGFFLLISL